jgi:hypothetical protein
MWEMEWREGLWAEDGEGLLLRSWACCCCCEREWLSYVWELEKAKEFVWRTWDAVGPDEWDIGVVWT